MSSVEIKKVEQTETERVRIFGYSVTLMKKNEIGLGYAHPVE